MELMAACPSTWPASARDHDDEDKNKGGSHDVINVFDK
jgi:hypothetical protein